MKRERELGTVSANREVGNSLRAFCKMGDSSPAVSKVLQSEERWKYRLSVYPSNLNVPISLSQAVLLYPLYFNPAKLSKRGRGT